MQRSLDHSLDDPNGLGASIVATAACMIVLSTIVVPLRLLSRHMAKNSGYWWDDWLIVAAWVCCAATYTQLSLVNAAQFLLIIFDGLTLGMVANGFGAHIGTVSKPQLLNLELYLYIGQLFYNVGLTLLKLSVLLFYVRVFTLRKMWFNVTVWVVGGLCIAWVFGISFMAAFKCQPVQKAFNPTLSGTCIDFNATIYATAISNTIIDVFILIMPVPHLWTLQASLARRVSLGVIFLFGYVYVHYHHFSEHFTEQSSVLGLSIGRLVVGLQDGRSTSTDFTCKISISVLAGPGLPATDYTADTGILTMLEGGMGVVSVCMPALLQLFLRLQKLLLRSPWFSNVSSSIFKRDHPDAHMGLVANPIDPSYRNHKQYENISLADVSGAVGHNEDLA